LFFKAMLGQPSTALNCLAEVDMEAQKNKDILTEPLVVINIGLKEFAEALEIQDVDVLQVDWVPPAGGDHELMDILDKLL
jgi:hypothetical protein